MTSIYVTVCKALYDYSAQTEDELDLKENDLLYIIENDDPEWWKAKKKPDDPDEDGPIGLVPSNYVEPAEPIAVIKALYDYAAQTDEELSFKEDQVMHLYDKDDQDWWYVSLDNTYGFVPSNYVEEISADETPAEEVTSNMTPTDIPDAPEIKESKEPAKKQRPDDIKTWPVSEVDKKKKKKKGTLGVGNGTILFASEADKAPVQQWPISDVSSFSQDKKHVFIEFGGSKPASFDFHAGSKDTADAIINKITECQELMGINKFSTNGNGHADVDKATVVAVPLPPPLPTFPSRVATSLTAHENDDGPIEDRTEPEAERELEPVPDYAEEQSYENADTLEEDATIESSYTKRGIVLYDFDAQGNDELTIRADQEIEIIDDVASDEWWKCRLGDQEGVVPASYIELINGEINGEGELSQPDEQNAEEEDAAATAAAAAEERRLEQEATKRKQAAAAAAEADRKRREVAARAAQEERQRKEEEVRLNAAAREDARKKKQAAAKTSLAAIPKLPARKLPSKNEDSTAKRVQASADRPAQLQSKSKPDPLKTRTWVDSTGGFKVEAEFLGFHDGKVHLHKLNGIKIAVPMAKMSDVDAAYVEKLTGRSIRPKLDNTDTTTFEPPPIAPRPTSSQPKRPNYDWFGFFLECGIDVDDCTRYASSFTRDNMDESILDSITHGTMRTLGLKEGDILRVGKHLERIGNSGKRAKGVSFGKTSVIPDDENDDEVIARRIQAQEAVDLRKQNSKPHSSTQIAQDEELARRLQEEENQRSNGSMRRGRPQSNRNEITKSDLEKSLKSVLQTVPKVPESPRLFADGASGVLKNNTNKSRPQPSKPAPRSVDVSSITSASDKLNRTTSGPSSKASDVELSFDDDAWIVKPTASESAAKTAAGITASSTAIESQGIGSGGLTSSVASEILQPQVALTPTRTPTESPFSMVTASPTGQQIPSQVMATSPAAVGNTSLTMMNQVPMQVQFQMPPPTPPPILSPPPRQRPVSQAKTVGMQQQLTNGTGMMMTSPSQMGGLSNISQPMSGISNPNMMAPTTMNGMIPQMTGMMPQMTGYSQQQQSMQQQLMQQQLMHQQSMQQLNQARSPPAPVPANEVLLKPLISTHTGMNGIIPTGIQSQQTGFQLQPQSTGYHMPLLQQQSQNLSSTLQPQITGYNSVVQVQQPIQAQPTGLRANLAAASPFDPFGKGAQISNFVPMSGGGGSLSTSNSTSIGERYQPANVFASMKTGALTANPTPDRYSALRQGDANFSELSPPNGVFNTWNTGGINSAPGTLSGGNDNRPTQMQMQIANTGASPMMMTSQLTGVQHIDMGMGAGGAGRGRGAGYPPMTDNGFIGQQYRTY